MTETEKPLRVLVAGLGNMGLSHALAYAGNGGFEIAGLVNRSPVDLPAELSGHRVRPAFREALAELKPDVASICTYSDSHAENAILALEAGAHVFVEKPLATTVADAERVVAAARANGRKLVVGYILRHHPSWTRLIAEARALGGPYVFRMNLNQQSSGKTWETHRSADGDDLAYRRLRRALCRRHVPDHRREAGAGARHGRPALRRDRAGHVQLRPSAGDLRRRLRRLVRGGLGTDDLRQRLLREGHHDPEGLPSPS